MKDNQPVSSEILFKRNIGIMSGRQLFQIRNTPVAVAGLGLGGSVFLNLVRMGFVDFHIADPDIYEATNCNRQRLAKANTLGRRKDECVFEEARAINPDVQIRMFRDGVTLDNVDEFLRGRAWVVDAIDVFAMKEKLALHERARAQGLPVVSCASVGFMGVSVLFGKESPSFGDLSGISTDLDQTENFSRFVRFITPELPDYMATQVLEAIAGRGHIPFVVQGVEISAGLASSLVANGVLNLRKLALAPVGYYIDPLAPYAGQFEAYFKARELPIRVMKKIA